MCSKNQFLHRHSHHFSVKHCYHQQHCDYPCPGFSFTHNAPPQLSSSNGSSGNWLKSIVSCVFIVFPPYFPAFSPGLCLSYKTNINSMLGYKFLSIIISSLCTFKSFFICHIFQHKRTSKKAPKGLFHPVHTVPV